MTRATAFVEDYRWLREQGFSNRDIATRFGVQWASLRRRCFRHGCWIPDPLERVAHLRLVELRETGEPFPLDQVGPADLPIVCGLISAEVRAGRLVKVSTTKWNRSYRGVAA